MLGTHEKGPSIARAFLFLTPRSDQAAVEVFWASLSAFCWAASASSRRISDSFFCTCSAKTYCAGRCLLRSISGAIGPDVLMPGSTTHIALHGLLSAAV